MRPRPSRPRRSRGPAGPRLNARSPLTIRDLARLAAIAAEATNPHALFAAAGLLVQRTIGHKLFTVTRVHQGTQEVERLYSTNAQAYPVGGRKQKQDTDWGRVVLTEGRVFVARTPGEIRRAFPDHERLGSLGIGSIMNVPIAVAGRCLGVMNVSHEANWFTREDAEHGRVIAALLAPALLGAEDGGGQGPGRATHALTTLRQGRGSERATGRGSSERGAARGAGS